MPLPYKETNTRIVAHPNNTNLKGQAKSRRWGH